MPAFVGDASQKPMIYLNRCDRSRLLRQKK